MVSYVLPKALKNSANVIANRELVIELAGGSGMLDIYGGKTFVFYDLPDAVTTATERRQSRQTLPVSPVESIGETMTSFPQLFF